MVKSSNSLPLCFETYFWTSGLLCLWNVQIRYLWMFHSFLTLSFWPLRFVLEKCCWHQIQNKHILTNTNEVDEVQDTTVILLLFNRSCILHRVTPCGCLFTSDHDNGRSLSNRWVSSINLTSRVQTHCELAEVVMGVLQWVSTPMTENMTIQSLLWLSYSQEVDLWKKMLAGHQITSKYNSYDERSREWILLLLQQHSTRKDLWWK